MKLIPKSFYLAIFVSLGMVTIISPTKAFAAAPSDWQPVASDKLITLPANIIEKRIEQDFSASPMASRLAEIDEQMQNSTQRIQALQKDEQKAEGEGLDNLQYELVQEKSAYLDQLQESHQLRKQALIKKQRLYEDVLVQFRNQHAGVDSQVRIQIKRQQQDALSRMESVMAQVDQNLMHSGYQNASPYADEYASNLAQIEQLKTKINQHKANAAPMIDGAEVSSEEYIRQLLHDASMHHSLLDQEGLMLSYMARLVALDAQALEYKIAYGDEDIKATKPQVARASKAVDLFL